MTAPPVPADADPGTGRVLALDLGSARVGCALSDRDRRVALGHGVLDGRDPGALTEAVAGLCATEQVCVVLVGVPLRLDGRRGPEARRAEQTIALLARSLEVPVVSVDERRSTLEAAALRLEAVRARDAARRGGRGGRAGRPRGGASRPVLDAEAAAAFLQTYLDSRRRDAHG